MCTVFTDKNNKSNILAKNYDCFIDGGMIFTNKKNMKKKSLVMPPEKEFQWTSKYASVTFSQSGKGMPLCGMNEKGLIVEQATYPATVYSYVESKESISCLEATQYILDMCSDVEQAILSFSDFNISNQSGKIHFFLMDKGGKRAIVEFVKGEMILVDGIDFLPVLTNSNYQALCDGAKQSTSEYEDNSFMRFQIVRDELEKETSLTVDAAFAILKKAKRQDTAWCMVYDLNVDKIFFQSKNQNVNTIDLKDVFSNENMDSCLYDIESEGEFAWQPYTREMNRKNVEKFYGNPGMLQVLNLPDAKFVIDSFDDHIQRIEEGII